tara:strand:+ start:2387 stop:3322 length:936 start_codon:yes stop_codon:yes gene_type:complete
MAWTAPRTWVAGDVLTAAQLNEQIKANELILITPLDVLGNLSPDIETSSVTSNQNNLAITVTTGTLVFTGASAIDITGIVAPATAGKLLSIVNRGSGTHTLKDQVTSTAANRFDLGADVELATDDSIALVYENSRWRAWCKPPAGASPAVVAYAVTTANVVNTVAETTVLSFEVPANAWADGDVIFCWMDALFKNNEGSSRNITGKVNVGSGSQVQILSQSYGNSATEYQSMGMVCSFMRSGSAVLVGANHRDWGVPMGAIYPGGDGVVGTSSPANFTDAQTVYLKLTLAAADSTFYVQPQNARAWKVAAS